MATYLYCVALGTAAPGMTRGIDDAPVDIIAMPELGRSTDRPVAAWVGSTQAPVGVTAEHAQQHDRVCQAAIDLGADVMPARFGQVFHDGPALVGDYVARASSIERLWEHIAGCVEMALLVPVPPAALQEPPSAAESGPSPDSLASTIGEAGSTGTGRAYLRRIAGPIRASSRAREWVEPLRVRFRGLAGDLVRDEAVRVQLSPAAVSLCHLVRRDDIAVHRAIAAELMESFPLSRMLASGPHAPYSFVSLGLTTTPHDGETSAAPPGHARDR